MNEQLSFGIPLSRNHDQALSVSQLNQYVKTLLDRDDVLSSVSVRGEISNLSAPKSGHYYFSLKDSEGLIRCVMFRSRAASLSFPLANGLQVVARGSVTLYPRDGVYQLYVDAVSRDGVGALWLAYEELRRKLDSEGLFDPNRKKPIPRFPRRIGIITSPTGAAIRDMIRILGRRYPLAELLIYPARVQGIEAAGELAAGIEYFSRKDKIDVVIIGRGGGSFEDLFCFNDETLARTIAESSVPVISAVGHETDFTICDFVSDLRAPTPSAAAELAVPDREELLSRLQAVPVVAARRLTQKTAACREKLEALTGRPVIARPETLLREKTLTVGRLTDRAYSAFSNAFSERKKTFSSLGSKLAALNPLATLSRGYSVTETPDGRTVSSVCDRKIGDPIRVLLRDGSLSARVTSVDEKGE